MKKIPWQNRLLDGIDTKNPSDKGCWLWKRSTTGSGYGHFTIDGKFTQAHRAAYEHFIGPVPEGMLACHTCDVRLCCNPSHLFLGTYADNTKDMISKGRASGGAPFGALAGESNGQCKLSDDEVELLRSMVDEKVLSQREIAEIFGISQQHVSNLSRNMRRI